jgi:uncharacterized protein (DUF1778 family)
MPTRAARLYLRLSATDKACISRAADLQGVSLATFVRQAVLREAESVMASASAVELSSEEARHFLAALDAPFKSDARLQGAMEDAAPLAR